VKNWDAYKDRCAAVRRYLKYGGRPAVRAHRERGPGGSWHEAGSEAVFAAGASNYATRREELKRRLRFNKVVRRARRSGRDPVAAIRRYLGESPKARAVLPSQAPRPRSRAQEKREKKSWLGRLFGGGR
jgi:hypothetical protein